VSSLHVVLPDGIDDPDRPSGGNRYDRRVIDGLRSRGWAVQEAPVAGTWPTPAPAALAALDRCLTRIDDSAVVLVDGLVASAADAVLQHHAGRLRVVVLMHMPLGAHMGWGPTAARSERRVLASSAAVIATSAWTRDWVIAHCRLPHDRVQVAEPGVDPSTAGAGSTHGGRLLCVAAVVPDKGHDVLVDALARVGADGWDCRCIGSLDRDPAFATRVEGQARACGLADRVVFSGPLTGAELGAAYASADLLVLPSRHETYGMVVTEALARAVPVVASRVGGVPDALGRGPGGVPGILVPPGDAALLAEAVDTWLADPAIRRRLRTEARGRRRTLRGWDTTTDRVARVLTRVAA
jgi:glycosyltransferase involved in cell wall biosynthesis